MQQDLGTSFVIVKLVMMAVKLYTEISQYRGALDRCEASSPDAPVFPIYPKLTVKNTKEVYTMKGVGTSRV